MGVNLSPLIKPTKTNLAALRNKKVAIDAFNTIYQFLASIRQPDGTQLKDLEGNITSHLAGILYRSTKLLEYNIKIVYVFDGKPIELKRKEIERRKRLKKEAINKFERAVEEEREDIAKLAKATMKLSKEMVEESKELLDAMGIPFVVANHEGEAKASIMCKQGIVDYTASQDYDPLLFGSPKLLRNLSIQGKRRIRGREIIVHPEEIMLKELLERNNINQEQLIYIGILIGTDFNKGVRRVAAKTALKIVKEYKTFDKIKEFVEQKYEHKFNEDIDKVIEFFKDPEEEAKEELNWKKPDKERLIDLLVEKHDFSEEKVNKVYRRLIEAHNKMMQKGITQWLS